MPRLNPKQIRAKKVADSVRKAMKTGGKKRAVSAAEENARRLREHVEARVNTAYAKATNP